jgi:1,4-alpha-glucan branching enzyme
LKVQILLFSLSYKSINEIVMAIKKQFVKTKPVCKVTFSVAAKEASQASVVGDFNNWSVTEGALSKLKNGTFKGVFDVNKDAAYEFKYVIDGTFVNEPEADSFKWNEFAGNENGVLVV